MHSYKKAQRTWKTLLDRAKVQKPSVDVAMRLYFRGDKGPEQNSETDGRHFC